jgi:hypothetical protein
MIKMPETQTTYYPMRGGLDLVTPAIAMDPGKVLDAQNYEPAPVGGYRRINGYERFDGRTSPTSASYWLMTITLTGTLAVGNTITGSSSGATAKVLQTGATLVLGRLSGVFVAGETLTVAAVVQATAASVAMQNGATSPSDHADYKLLAANDYRADILKPPGSGAPRGGFVYQDVCYCFRDNAGGTAGNLWKQTAGGWVQVTFGRELQFTGATGQINDGDTVTGASSGATAVVIRAMLRTGTWTVAGVGTLIFASVTGTFTNGENIQVGGVTKAVASGGDTAIARAVGGHIETVVENFTGALNTKRVYGVDGVNFAFEFDGVNYIPIRTGMAADAPAHLAYHRNHLFLSFLGALQYSGVGQPYSYTLLTGANEIGMGDVISGMLRQFCRRVAGGVHGRQNEHLVRLWLHRLQPGALGLRHGLCRLHPAGGQQQHLWPHGTGHPVPHHHAELRRLQLRRVELLDPAAAGAKVRPADRLGVAQGQESVPPILQRQHRLGHRPDRREDQRHPAPELRHAGAHRLERHPEQRHRGHLFHVRRRLRLHGQHRHQL